VGHEHWDARYREASDEPLEPPASIVEELLPLLRRGDALDLACGSGRHALLLAQNGFRVLAIDASEPALELAAKRALEAGIDVCRVDRFGEEKQGAARGITLLKAELESSSLPGASFDLILCVHYLQRSLFPQIQHALRPGGMLVFETFTKHHLEFGAVPRNPDFLLGPHELHNALPCLRTIFYRELRAGKGIASLLAQRAS